MGSIPPKLGPYRGNENFRQTAENRNFKKFTIWYLLPTRLCRATTTKPRQIERSSFFLLDHNGKTRIYRLVSGSFDVSLQRKRDSPMEEDDCSPPPALIRVIVFLGFFFEKGGNLEKNWNFGKKVWKLWNDLEIWKKNRKCVKIGNL